MKSYMTTQQILDYIRENGEFDNFNNWNMQEIAEWVQNYFDCSMYVANNVSRHLV